MKTNRKQPVAASLPDGMIKSGFDIDPRQILICETEVYGLISGPSWLRQSVVGFLEKLGYVRNPYEKCAMVLPPEPKALIDDKSSGGRKDPVNDGLILIEVDDVLEGGNQRHRKSVENFYETYKCGKREKIVDLGDEGTLISGIRVRRHRDKRSSWDMNEYTATKLQGIEYPRGLI